MIKSISFRVAAVMILIILAIPLPVSIVSSSEDTKDHLFRASLKVSIGGLKIDEITGEITIRRPGIEYTGNISVGFSDGAILIEVVDPEPGSPMIPWISTVIETGKDIDQIYLERSKEIPVTIPSEIATIPSPSSHWGEGEPYGIWDFSRSYPEEPIRLEPIGYKHRGGELRRVYSMWFCPLRLDQEEGAYVTLEGNVKVSMSDELTEPSSTRAEGDPSLVPGSLSITESMDIPPEYIIITDTRNVDKLQVLAEWRNKGGIATSVIDVNSIIENYAGSDDPADLLREYIKDVHSGWGKLKYVMLAGDWDTVPVKYVLDSNPSYWDDGVIPADTFYQCLDGTWDLDGNGIFGEPGDIEDLIPDVTLSRLAINDESIWEKKIDQIIRYEKGEKMGEWSDTSVLLGAHTHSEGDGAHFSDYLWNKYLDGVYGSVNKLYEDDGSLSHSSIDRALSDGATFLQFVDHGGPNEWCDDYGAGVVYRSRDARSLKNDVMMPFISALACLTTWFDDTSGCPYGNWENCLGESFTENVNGGAIGYVGSSRVSVGIINTNRYLPYDNGLIEDIARQIGGMNNYVTGDIHRYGKTHYAEVWGGQFSSTSNPEVALCWYEFTILGEPAIDLWTGGSERLGCDVEHEDDLDPHISITVTDESGEPVPQANVTLQNFDRNVFKRGTTDERGKVIFDLVLDWFCDINLTIVKHDMIPFSGFIRISDIIPPQTTLLTDPPLPDGENGWFHDLVGVTLLPNEDGRVHYRLNNGNYVTLNETVNFTITEFPEGEHDLYYFGEDLAGNLETERHSVIKVDRSDPELKVMINPAEPDGENGWYTTEPMICMDTDDEDPGSEVSFKMRVNGQQFPYELPVFIGEGENQIEMWAVDESGRTSNVSILHPKVDITPPSTKTKIFPSAPDGENGWYITNPVVSFIPSETGCTTEYRTSKIGDFKPHEGDLILEDGQYYLEYRSIDQAGNLEETSAELFEIDTSPPGIGYRLTPPIPDGDDGWYRTSPSLMLQWNDEHDSSIMFSMDGSGWTEWKGSLNIDDGVHRIEAYSKDVSGQRSEIIRLDIRVDTIDPETQVIVSGAKKGDWYSSVPSISMRSSEDSKIFYRFRDDPEYTQYTSPFSPKLIEGTDVLHFMSRDRAGNTEMERTLILNVDIEKPNPVLDFRIMDDERVHLSASRSTDGNEMEYRFSVDGVVVRDWSVADEVEIKLDRGVHFIRLDVRDQAGNVASRSIQMKMEGPDRILLIIGAASLMIIFVVVVLLIMGRKKRSAKLLMDEYYDQTVSR